MNDEMDGSLMDEEEGGLRKENERDNLINKLGRKKSETDLNQYAP